MKCRFNCTCHNAAALGATAYCDRCEDGEACLRKKAPTRTPDTLYVVRQSFSKKLMWIVDPVPAWQGKAMRKRKYPHVYSTRATAEAVKKRLNLGRTPDLRQRVLEDIK